MESFGLVIERMNSRLEGWKTKCLSFAGRYILAQSVLSAIPLYPMQTFIFPKGLCLKIEEIIITFLWGGTTEDPKVSLINWETVTAKKDLGSLGIKRMHEMNIAFLAKP